MLGETFTGQPLEAGLSKEWLPFSKLVVVKVKASQPKEDFHVFCVYG